MKLIDILCIARFNCFQHIPDDEKLPVFKTILDIASKHYSFEQVIQHFDGAFKLNRWTEFIVIVKEVRFNLRRFGIRPRTPLDADLMLQIFMEEEDPNLAAKILKTLLDFSFTFPEPDEAQRSTWNICTHLLLNTHKREDKMSALSLMSSLTPVFCDP